MRKIAIAALLACTMAGPALAQEAVSLGSAVFIERMDHGGDGRIERKIEPASRLVAGDRVVLMVEWQSRGKTKPFEVTSPIPRSLSYQRSGHEGEQVSVDGGRSWGELGTLRIHDAYGTRLATPEDVTDLRWRVSSREAARGSGRIAYSAIVR
jgi:hypothetical protein